MMRTARIAIAAAVLMLGSMAAAQDARPGAGPGARAGVKTDLAYYDPGPAPALPKAGGTFTDPVYGTTLLRVTDERDGKQNHLAYSYWPTFNRDATRFHISSNGQAMLYDFAPATLKINKKGPLFEGATSAGGQPRWEDSIWSGKDPNVIFAQDLRRLWAYDVVKKQYTLLKDFDAPIQQMSRSIDDNVFAFTSRGTDGKESAIIWQRDADKVTKQSLSGLDEVQIDKSGRFLAMKLGAQGAGVLSVQVLDRQTGKIEDLIDDAPDYAPGHSDNGNDLCVGHDNFRNQMTGRRLSAPHQHITVLDLKRDWSLGMHVSMLADDERWCVLSFYGDKPSKEPFHNEIIQVATDGSGRVRRLVNHRGAFGGEYWQIPMANITRDGRFIAFASNYNGSGQTDVFILQVPALTEQEKYPMEKHPLMGAGTEAGKNQ